MKRIVLRGKVWEVRYLLKQYQRQFFYVTDWIQTMESVYQNAPEKQAFKLIKNK